MNLCRGLIVAAAALSLGCAHVFPPPPTPGPIRPALLDTPIAPGRGRVYIDVVDGPTNVRVIRPVDVTETEVCGPDSGCVGTQVFQDTVLETELWCRTPCVLDLTLGDKLIGFPMRGWGQEEIDTVTVSPTPSLYRKALGWGRSGGGSYALGILGVTFGGVSFVTGAALLPVGLATDKSGFTTSGAITLGVGAVLTTLGIWAISANPKLKQPGAGAQYDLTGQR
jgi:hypothetical protein